MIKTDALPPVPEAYQLITGRNPLGSGRRHRKSEEGMQGREIFMRCVNAASHKNGDSHPSLRISAEKDTWVCDPCGVGGRSIQLIKHAGLAYDNSGAFAWLRKRGWGPLNGRQVKRARINNLAPAGDRVAAYSYRDEKGNTLYEVLRYEPKAFSQRRPDGSGGYINNLDGVRRVPYRLPEVFEAIAHGDTIVILEGEKDADRAASRGLSSTTNAGGTGFRWTEEFMEPFKGALRIRVVCDSDEAGRKAARQRAQLLATICKDVKLIDLFPNRTDGSDLSNFFNEGNSLNRFKELCRQADGVEPGVAQDDDNTKPHLRCVPASAVIIKRTEWFMPNWLPLNELTVCDGDGGIGKTTIVLHVIAKASAGEALPDGTTLDEKPTVVILAEEDNLSILKAKLTVGNADLTRIHFATYVQCGGDESNFWLPQHVPLLAELAKKHNASLFYMDSLFSHLSAELNANRAQDVRFALRPLVELAHADKLTIAATRHWTKSPGSASSRGLGSVDIRNISRSVISFAKHPTRFDDEGIYVMAVSKSNYSRTVPVLLYKIIGEPTVDDYGKSWEVAQVSWQGTDGTTADDIASEPDAPAERSARDEAREIILEFLGTGEKSSEEIDRHMASEKITVSTYQRARRDLRKEQRIERHGGGVAGRVRWSLIVTSPTNRHVSNGDEEWDQVTKSDELGQADDREQGYL